MNSQYYVSSPARKWIVGVLMGAACIMLSAFDFSRHSIPLDEIMNGGPGKDGIPALLKPKFISSAEADQNLGDADRVLGLHVNGEAKAYPVKILNWHEIVNDHIGGKPVVVTFCPLCGTGMVFEAVVRGKRLTFGVSGLLYQSDVLLYDHQTESLWSQIRREAVTGPMTGTRLHLIPSTHTTWGNWKKKYPHTLVLSRDTGYHRNYDRDPYQGYYSSSRLMFGVNKVNRAFHPKERVIGIVIGKSAKAYPFSKLGEADSPVEDTLNGVKLRIYFDKTTGTAEIYDDKGNLMPAVVGFWFAWYAFHPETRVFQGD